MQIAITFTCRGLQTLLHLNTKDAVEELFIYLDLFKEAFPITNVRFITALKRTFFF